MWLAVCAMGCNSRWAAWLEFGALVVCVGWARRCAGLAVLSCSTSKEFLAMNRIKILILALLTVCSVGVAMTSSASAEVSLPEFMTETSGTATAGEGELVSSSGTAFKCRGFAAALSFLSHRLGDFTFDFHLCTSKVLGVTLGCKSLGDRYDNSARPNEGGTILENGTWHLVRPFYLIWFLIKEVHLECSNEKLTITSLNLNAGQHPRHDQSQGGQQK